MNRHPLVDQLHFTRSELVALPGGRLGEDAVRRVMPLNCLSWIRRPPGQPGAGLLGDGGQRPLVVPGLNDLVGHGKPASTPPLDEMWAAWRPSPRAADEYLDTLTTATLQTHLVWRGAPRPESIGTMLRRNTYTIGITSVRLTP